MLLRNTWTHCDPAYSWPVGGDTEAILAELEETVRPRCGSLLFTFVPAEGKDVLLARYPNARVEEERDWYDYLYDRDSYVTLAGRHLSGQRNHISRFQRGYPDWSCLPLDGETVPRALEFYLRLAEKTDKGTELYEAEHDVTLEALGHMDLYGLDGCLLLAGENVAGFTLGETVGDTVFVHVEKADTDFVGAYPMLAREYAKMTAREGVRFYNREDDAGDEGLRRAKLAYRPCRLLEKYTIRAEL